MTPADADFQRRASTPGLIRAIKFDSDAALGDKSGQLLANVGIGNATYNGVTVQPYIDHNIFPSGSGSMCFDIPDLWPASMGAFYANFSTDYSKLYGPGGRFFVQFRYRQDRFMYDTVYKAVGGGITNPKLMDINAGDQKPGYHPWADGITHFSSSGGWARNTTWSSGDIKVVCVPHGAHKFPAAYHYWPNAAGGTSDSGLYDGFNMQNAMPNPPGCQYAAMRALDNAGNFGSSVPGCWTMLPDEWMTFQMEVLLGQPTMYPTPFNGIQYEVWDKSEVRLWGAHEGEPSQIIVDWTPSVPDYVPLLTGYRSTDSSRANCLLGKVWLMPYMTGRDPAVKYGGVGRVYYDELLIGEQRFPDPQPAAGVYAMPTPAQQTVLDDAEKTLNDACAEAGVTLLSIPSVASAVAAATAALQAKIDAAKAALA